jgi:transcription elongation factor Elf1
MSFIDIKYARIVGSRLDKFKEKKSTLYNFRCPYCGDSQKQASKARGYFFTKQNDIIFKCHNCGVGRTLGNFLKDQARDIYDQYVLERYKDGLTGKRTRVANPKPDVFKAKPVFNTGTNLPTISSLNTEHPARQYLEQRGITGSKLDLIYYAEKFKEYVNSQKHTFDNLQNDRPRIIIPLIDKDGKWFGVQGRSLMPNSRLRYITILYDETKTKVFGQDRLDSGRTVYLVEGPFDSLFLENGAAMCGSDLDPRSLGWSDCVFVFDNEPRNKEITDRIAATIGRGYKVVIFPSGIQQKDLNDMVLAGHNVQNLVESNTYSGLEAKLKLSQWKKV